MSSRFAHGYDKTPAKFPEFSYWTIFGTIHKSRVRAPPHTSFTHPSVLLPFTPDQNNANCEDGTPALEKQQATIHMRHVPQHDASASTRPRAHHTRFLSVMLGSLSVLGMIHVARSQSLAERQLADDWVKATVQTSFAGGEAKELAAYRKLQSRRARKNDERAPTKLEEQFKARLTEQMLTRLQEDRDPESIFEFENDGCELCRDGLLVRIF